jgi:membrane protein
VLLLVAALGVVIQLKDALNTISETKEPASAGVWWYLRTYLISFAGILGLGFLLAVSLVVSTLLSAFSSWLGGGESLLWQAVNFLVSVGVLAALFSMLFKWFPDADVRWKAALKKEASRPRFSSTSASSPSAGTSARKDWNPPTERQPP